jgi:hypothetical protein
MLSFVLHLPVTPLGPLFGLLGVLSRIRDDIPEPPPEDLLGIPVELLSNGQAGPPATDQPTTDPAPDPNSVIVAPPKAAAKEEPKKEALDASVPKEEPTDAGLSDAGIDASVDASTADGGTTDLDAGIASADASAPDAGADGRAKRDPFAIAGNFPSPPKTNVNVKVHLFTSGLQTHSTGRVIAELLASEPQWRDFLGPAGLDPIVDLSRIAIYGPQLVDSSKVAVFLEYGVDTKEVIRAVEELVRKTPGARWTKERGKRVAYVKAASADRAIIFFPGKLIAIVPPGPVSEQLLAAKGLPALPEPSESGEVFQGFLRTPHRVRMFRRLGIEIPASISEGRLFLATLPNGGAHIRLELVDGSPELAKAHMEDLELRASALTFGLVPLNWSTDGASIHAERRLSVIQVGGLLSQITRRVEAARRGTPP